MADIPTQRIIGSAIEVHKQLARDLLESIYEEALYYEFELRNIEYKRQVGIDIIYRGRIVKGQKLDLPLENEVIIEIKSLMKVSEYAMAQTLSYLKATNLKRGLLINFGEKDWLKE